jgi:drug/metabolite transporter (DMT)-like permease
MLGCIYTSVRYLPLVYVALVSNLGPLFTALCSYYYLKKGLSRLDQIILLISFVGVILLITGDVSKTNTLVDPNNETGNVSLVLPIFCVLMVPVLTGTLAIT